MPSANIAATRVTDEWTRRDGKALEPMGERRALDLKKAARGDFGGTPTYPAGV
jgi:hypothetical protein